MLSLQRYLTPCCLQDIPAEPDHFEEPTIQYNDIHEDTSHDGDWFVQDDPIYLQGRELAAILNEQPEPVRNMKRNQ